MTDGLKILKLNPFKTVRPVPIEDLVVRNPDTGAILLIPVIPLSPEKIVINAN